MEQRANSRNTARDLLVATAVEHLARRGPAGIQPQEVCRELGMSKALVNYHFGNREGLIAEAMVAAYEDHVRQLWAAAEAAGDDPVDRLMSWIDAQVRWTAEHRGLAAALGFPDVAVTQPDAALDADLQRRLADTGRRNFANLQVLVHDARQHLRRGAGDDRPDAGDDGFVAASVGWLTAGMAVWAGGTHVPVRGSADREPVPFSRAQVRSLVTDLLSRP